MIKAEKGRVTTLGLFCLLVTARLSGLAVTRGITVFSFLVQLALSVLLSLIVYKISERGLSLSRGVLLPLITVVSGATALTLFDFKENALTLNVPDLFIALILIACVSYSSSLGAEGVSRFSQLSALILVVSLILGMLFNIQRVNIYEEIKPEIFRIYPESIIKCLDIPVLYLVFSPYVQHKKEKALAASVAVSYGLSFILYLMSALVLREASAYYNYPVFALFQLGEIGGYNKLDILYSAPLTAAIFTKLSALFVRVKK